MEDKAENLFDNFAENYAQTLNKSLRLSGENTDFFAKERVKWTKRKIDCLFPQLQINSVLDFGCGTGNTLPIIEKIFNVERLTGIDISEECIAVAKRNSRSSNISFYCLEDSHQINTSDMVYCNGVFHHIPIAERNEAIKLVYNSLTKNGIWAFWENNFLNPGTRHVMHNCPFDKDAVPISYRESKKILTENGFKIADVSFLFIFPKSLNFLRFLEKNLSLLPIGAQYLIIAQKI